MAHRNLTPAGDATSLASSSSTLDSNINSSVYDVFINHRGPDVKKGLASHIYHRLIEHGLRVFLDQQVLQEGENITPQIKGAIRTASVHIAIFSPEYAKSHWCLDELSLMVESGSTILPVFYKVQPSELRWTRGENGVYARALSIFLCILLSVLLCIPMSFLFRFLMCVPFSIIMCILLCTRGENGVYARDLRWTRGKDGVYARALRELQNKRSVDPETNETKPRHDSDTIEKWRKALSDVSNISGFELKKYNDDEGELVYEVVQQVLRKMDRDSTPLTQIPIHIPSPGFVGDAIKSAQSKLEEWLTEDSNIRIIGVHGMGGVGKTSLLQNINNSQKVSSSFDLIIWVTVSKDYDISNLQDCIADRLRLQLPHKSNMPEREYKLRSCLKDKKCLLILDDMWKSLKLQSIGVSLDESSCKIVLSTRNKEVCTRMGAKDIITVVPLSEEEAWHLFCSRAFGNESVPQEIEDIARGIARECKGLPLAIMVVAAAMKGKGYPHEWEYALLQMQTVDKTFYDLHDGMDQELFQHLKWSYDVLPDYLKTCFVYFAAYPEDTHINCEEVIDIWIAEGLVKGSGEIYLRDTGHSFINFLRDRCLIEVASNNIVGRVEYVKIHDILRDLAILIAEKEHGCYFKAGQGLSHFPSEEDSVGCARMSLMKTGLHSLPPTFRCSSLSVLLLRENYAIKEVPGSFLNELRSLRVLYLSQTRITSLPLCIENLKHLASLQLMFTNISELPEIICDLKELQFLNVRGCKQLRFLPERISELKSLRALDISRCERLSHLPRGISELVTLERLTMADSSIRLDFEEEANAEERKYGCLKDLQSLRRLRVLEVQIKSPVKDGVMGNWSKMRDLTLQCEGANQDYLPQDMQAMKDLESFTLDGCDVERLPRWVSDFRKLTYLYLCRCEQLKELPAELPCLRELFINNCDKLEELELGMGFPKLERLNLMDLKSLECVGAVAAASGSGGLGEGASPLPPMLKYLGVSVCLKLKRLRGDKLKCLEEIWGSRGWWDAIQWEDPNMKASLQSKFRGRGW